MSENMKKYRFLITDRDNPEEDAREVLVSLPERDDLSAEHVKDLLAGFGAELVDWYEGRHGWSYAEVRCGSVVDSVETLGGDAEFEEE